MGRRITRIALRPLPPSATLAARRAAHAERLAYHLRVYGDPAVSAQYGIVGWIGATAAVVGFVALCMA